MASSQPTELSPSREEEEQIERICDAAQRIEGRWFAKATAISMLCELAGYPVNNSSQDLLQQAMDQLGRSRHRRTEIEKVMRWYLREAAYRKVISAALAKNNVTFEDVESARATCDLLDRTVFLEVDSELHRVIRAYYRLETNWIVHRLMCWLSLTHKKSRLFHYHRLTPNDAPVSLWSRRKAFCRNAFPSILIGLVKDFTLSEAQWECLARTILAELCDEDLQAKFAGATRNFKNTILAGNFIPRWARGRTRIDDINDSERSTRSEHLAALVMRLKLWLRYYGIMNSLHHASLSQKYLKISFQCCRAVEFDQQLSFVARKLLAAMISRMEQYLSQMDDELSGMGPRYRRHRNLRRIWPGYKSELPRPADWYQEKFWEKEMYLAKSIWVLCQLSKHHNSALPEHCDPRSLGSFMKDVALDDAQEYLQDWADQYGVSDLIEEVPEDLSFIEDLEIYFRNDASFAGLTTPRKETLTDENPVRFAFGTNPEYVAAQQAEKSQPIRDSITGNLYDGNDGDNFDDDDDDDDASVASWVTDEEVSDSE